MKQSNGGHLLIGFAELKEILVDRPWYQKLLPFSKDPIENAT